MDMELEIEMDWEDMKAEIKDELMKELEKDSKDFMDADKENNGTPRKISHEIYNRLYSSYVQVTGENTDRSHYEQDPRLVYYATRA